MAERRTVDDAVMALRPDDRAVLVTADGLHAGLSDEVSETRPHGSRATAWKRLGRRTA
jgi:hypothetical protein